MGAWWRVPEPCLCGAWDCQKCFPGNTYLEDEAAAEEDAADRMIYFLEDEEWFGDSSSDAIFCPGNDKRVWDQRTDEIRALLLRIHEARQRKRDDSGDCADLATAMLTNISDYLADTGSYRGAK
jgi:hypothetical protein